MLSLCLATSLDGKLNCEQDDLPRFTSREDRNRLFRLRAVADLLVVGAGTVRRETLAPLVRNPQFAALREGRPEQPAVAIVTRTGKLPFRDPYFTERQQEFFVLTPTASDELRQQCAQLDIEVLEWGDGSLRDCLEALKARGFRRMLAEGGARLAYALLDEDLVERLYLTLAPVIFAGSTAPSLVEGDAFDQPSRWRLDRAEPVGDELHLSYTRIRWSPTAD